MKKHTIIGMAGHIDHGKTALIRALTGIQTDRLKEEQERGITIDIGFAYWKENVTIIDVPGHEKFVRNMVAGVSTVDLFLLVIAADDGVMPQTVEHLEILKFFGVRDGVVALNKIDLVTEDWLMMVEEDIDQLLKKYGFADVPVIPVSTTQSRGMDDLLKALDLKMSRLEPRSGMRPFRLNVDRSFSAKGFGSIVTGTVLSGQVKVGDSLQILPRDVLTKVRGVQVHQQSREAVSGGQRAAINLAGLDKEELQRGTVLVEPDTIKPTREILALIKTIDHLQIKLKRHGRVHVHIGTQELIGRLNWFDEGATLESDQTYHMRIKLHSAAVSAPGDAILLRSISPVTTIAGGKILCLQAPGMRRVQANWSEIFNRLQSDKPEQRLEVVLQLRDFRPLGYSALKQQLFEHDDTLRGALDSLLAQKRMVVFEHKKEWHYLSREAYDAYIQQIMKTMQEYADEQPLSQGLNIQQIINRLKKHKMDEHVVKITIQEAVDRDLLIFDGSVYTLKKDTQKKAVDQIQDKILEFYIQKGFQPPDLNEVGITLGLQPAEVKNLTQRLSRDGLLKSISGKFYMHHQIFEQIIEFLRNHFSKNDQIDVVTFKTFIGGSRKFAIPMLEYFDANGYTRRSGDYRVGGPELNDD